MKDGSLIFTDVGTQFVNNVTKLKWTHVVIYLNKVFYEATWPVVRKQTRWPKARAWVLVEPDNGYAEMQLRWMSQFAEKSLGRRYQLYGYTHPKYFGKTKGTYCSEFVCDTLIEGHVELKKIDGYTPDALYQAITGYAP
jgi:hypothetical protein